MGSGYRLDVFRSDIFLTSEMDVLKNAVENPSSALQTAKQQTIQKQNTEQQTQSEKLYVKVI